MKDLKNLTNDELMQLIYETYETHDGKLQEKLKREVNRRWCDE